MVPDIFHKDFVPIPYWWEAYKPEAGELVEVPRSAAVAIVGGGYAGLSTALELAKQGIEGVVLEAGELGCGASTRNGGAVSGGVNLGKSYSGKTTGVAPEQADRILSDAADAFALIDRLIEEEKIACFWEKPGRFVGAWTRKHFDVQSRRLAMLNSAARSGAYMVPRERQREEIASDYYFGGMVVERSGKLHPALYYKGLLDACRRRDVAVCAKAAVRAIGRSGAVWRIETSRGDVSAGEVVVATNGYTGSLVPALRRRVVPIASHIIATEELPADLARSLIPKGRTLSDTRRVLCYYRLSPDGTRVVFGGRALHAGRRDGQRADPPPLHARSLPPAARRQGDPRLDRECGLHPRRHAAYGAPGRPPLLSRLQRQRGRDDDLSRLADGAQDRPRCQLCLQFRQPRLPRPSPLQRQSLVSAGRRRLLSAARQPRSSVELILLYVVSGRSEEEKTTWISKPSKAHSRRTRHPKD
jgi:glycine/D-amino acid oxidase-like deaminating enzyme